MLGFISGKLSSKTPETLQCIVVANQIGYEMTVSRRCFDSINLNSEIQLWLHTHVREDQITLFGFSSEIEKSFFRVLLSVSGLGPKGALSLLSEHGANKLVQLILQKDGKEICTAQGIGKKLAERIILDLTSKVEKLAWAEQIESSQHPLSTKTRPEKLGLKDDINSALTHLGFTPNQIKTTLDPLFEREEIKDMPFENCLRMALQEMSGKNYNERR